MNIDPKNFHFEGGEVVSGAAAGMRPEELRIRCAALQAAATFFAGTMTMPIVQEASHLNPEQMGEQMTKGIIELAKEFENSLRGPR